jgi:hypothetical protein
MIPAGIGIAVNVQGWYTGPLVFDAVALESAVRDQLNTEGSLNVNLFQIQTPSVFAAWNPTSAANALVYNAQLIVTVNYAVPDTSGVGQIISDAFTNAGSKPVNVAAAVMSGSDPGSGPTNTNTDPTVLKPPTLPDLSTIGIVAVVVAVAAVALAIAVR